MASGPNLNPLYKSGKNPCGVCLKGVGSNSIFWEGCKQWVQCGVPFLGPQKAVFGLPRARKAKIPKSPRTVFSNFVIDLIFQIWGF